MNARRRRSAWMILRAASCTSISPGIGVLKTTDGVLRASSQSAGDGVQAYELETLNNKDLREQVAQRIAKNGWTLRRLDMRRRTLEDQFVEVVLREEKPYSNEA